MLASLAQGTASSARAQPQESDFELQWTAPPACMSAGAARGGVAALIRTQRSAGDRARARVLIEGSEQRGYVARIEVARGASTGERELRGNRCDALAEAAVLIIAMAIDPEGVSAHGAAQSQTQGAGATKPAPAPVTTSARTPERDATKPAGDVEETKAERPEQQPAAAAEEAEPEEAEPLEEEEPIAEDEPSDPRRTGRIALGLRGTGDAGSLPHATIGGGLLGGVHWQHLRIELQALAYVPQVEMLAPAPGSTEISLYTGGLTGCLDLLGSRDQAQALGACAAVEAGLSRGAPRDISAGEARSGFWLASLLGVDVRQQLGGPLHVRLLAEAGVPVLRPAYEIEPFGPVFRASPVLGRFGISAFALFP